MPATPAIQPDPVTEHAPQTPASMLPHLPSRPATATMQTPNQSVGYPLPILLQLPQHATAETQTLAEAGNPDAGIQSTPNSETHAGADTSADATARAALQDLNNRGNLSDVQTKVLNKAQAALNAGHVARADRLAGTLDKEVRRATQTYDVSAGETLWQIAAQPEVYGNGYLWPLIWNSNHAQIPDPSSLAAGLRLKIRPYPTLAEVAAALDYSHRHGLSGFPKQH